MSVAPGYKIQRLAINTHSWTAVVIPFDTNGISIRCDNDAILMRTDTDDSNTQDSLALGSQEYILAPKSCEGNQAFVYLQAETNDGAIVIAKFVKGEYRHA